MKVIKNKKTHSSPSTGKQRVPGTRKNSETTDCNSNVIRPMVEGYKGVIHVAKPVPIEGQQELLKYCLSGVRRVTTIRCDSLLWKNFKEVCQREGLSTCRVLEKLILAWSVGVGYSRAPVVTVNVDMPRIVKRVRRRQLFFADEVSVEEISAGDKQSDVFCSFCDKPAVGYAEHKESGKKVFVCEYHKRCLSEHPKWKILQ